MKRIMFSIVTALAFTFIAAHSFAQSEERRNKVEMVVLQGAKAIKTELNSVSTSLTRYTDGAEQHDIKLAAGKDTSKTKIPISPIGRSGGDFYLTIEAKSISTDMMKILARSNARFEGTITVSEQLSQKPIKVIKFKQASVYSYSDQYTAVTYADAYGSAVLSLNCRELMIDGINIEL